MININISTNTKYKQAIINDVQLGFRALTTAETIKLMDIQSQFKEMEKTGKIAADPLKELLDLVFNLCDNPKKARELLSVYPITEIVEIYTQIMESEE